MKKIVEAGSNRLCPTLSNLIFVDDSTFFLDGTINEMPAAHYVAKLLLHDFGDGLFISIILGDTTDLGGFKETDVIARVNGKLKLL